MVKVDHIEWATEESIMVPQICKAPKICPDLPAKGYFSSYAEGPTDRTLRAAFDGSEDTMWHSCWKGTFGKEKLPCTTRDQNKVYIRFDEPQVFNNFVLTKRNSKQQYDHYGHVCVSIMDPAKVRQLSV